MGRHLEGAELEEPLPAAWRAPVEELVDAQLGTMGVARDVDQQMTKQPSTSDRGRGAALRSKARWRAISSS
jgi:hypothetical protein